MASNYKSGGTDLDSLFKINNAAGSISAEYKVSGSTSYDRYVSIGNTPKRADVGYKIGSTDISNNFQDANYSLSLPSITIDGGLPGATGAITLALNSNGTWVWNNSSFGNLDSGNWLTGASTSDYEAYVSPISGSAFSGPQNTWVNLGTGRNWTMSSSGTIKSCTFSLTIRQVSNNANSVSGSNFTIFIYDSSA